MDEEQILFEKISGTLSRENESISPGPMMSSPGIRYKNKVFAFYNQSDMIFKLGVDFEPESMEIKDYSLLSPFKNKAPMAAWFQIPFSEAEKWEPLAKLAMGKMVKQVG